jgi:3-oxoacyl-[acyl-carrier protein] reductase
VTNPVDIHFEGQTVAVTGAARGIGGGIVEGFAERGARVWACDLLVDELAKLKTRVKPGRGGDVETRALDLSKSDQVNDFVREVEKASGAIDILVHVAGGVRGQARQPVETVSDQAWEAIQDANLTTAFYTARAVVPGMKRKGAGRIVVISSRAGLGVSLTGIQSYATAKAGQIGLVRQLAHELGPFGITVNSVAPGFLRTSPDYERQWQSYGADGQKAMIERVAMRRLGEPEDIAHAVMFLASPYAAWITGQVLPVTGGPIA